MLVVIELLRNPRICGKLDDDDGDEIGEVDKAVILFVDFVALDTGAFSVEGVLEFELLVKVPRGGTLVVLGTLDEEDAIGTSGWGKLCIEPHNFLILGKLLEDLGALFVRSGGGCAENTVVASAVIVCICFCCLSVTVPATSLAVFFIAAVTPLLSLVLPIDGCFMLSAVDNVSSEFPAAKGSPLFPLLSLLTYDGSSWELSSDDFLVSGTTGAAVDDVGTVGEETSVLVAFEVFTFVESRPT